MRKLLLSAAILAIAASSVSGETVRIGTEGANPPYSSVNDAGQVEGFERELGDALCAMAKLDCTWVINDRETMIPNLLSGNYDAIMSGMTITEERDKLIDFTLAYLPPAPSVNVGLVGTEFIAGVEVGSTGVLSGSVHEAFIATTGKSLLAYATLDEAMAAVMKGEADTVLTYKSDLMPYVTESGGKLEVLSRDKQIGKGIAMGFREDDIDRRFQFEDAIYEMTQDGSLNALIKKWFGEEAATLN